MKKLFIFSGFISLSDYVDGGDVTGSILEAISKLEQKVMFLDGSATENLRARLNVYKLELESVLSTKQRAASLAETKILDAVKKLDELHSNTQKLMAAYNDLPALVLRLKTLEQVHMAAANATRQLARIDDAVVALETEVENNKATLATLNEVNCGITGTYCCLYCDCVGVMVL